MEGKRRGKRGQEEIRKEAVEERRGEEKVWQQRGKNSRQPATSSPPLRRGIKTGVHGRSHVIVCEGIDGAVVDVVDEAG